MYDVQTHQMHTQIQQHTYRSRIANSKTENIIYLLECAICDLQYFGETKQQLSKRHRSDANCKPDLPLSRQLRSEFGNFVITLINGQPWFLRQTEGHHNWPLPQVGWGKGKASGLENLRPYHRMESVRKCNILSSLLFLLVSPSRIMTYSLLNWPKVYIPHCGGPLFEWVWVSYSFQKYLWQCCLLH